MKQHRDLIDFEHDVGEEKLVAVLWLLEHSLVIPAARCLHLAASLVQVDPVAKKIIVALDLPDSCVEERMELRHSQVVQISTRSGQKVESEGNSMRFIELGGCILVSTHQLDDLDLC